MSIFSKIKKAGQKVAVGVYNTVNSIGGALKKAAPKAPAAAGMVFPVKPGIDLRAGEKARAAADAKTFENTFYQNQIPPAGFNPIKGGGNISNAERGQGALGTTVASPAPTNIYSSRSSGGSSSRTNSVTNFAPYSAPSTITPSILSGGTTRVGSSGSINNLPSGNSYASGAIGVMAGIKSTQKDLKEQADLYDPMTGELKSDQEKRKDQFDVSWLQDQISKYDETAPEINREEIRAQEERAVQYQEKQQLVNNYQAQLNTITAQAEADQLAVTGQGRGIPEPIILGQQNQIAKEAAIRALPIAAQLSAAQGNLQLAQDHLDTMYKMRVADAEDRYNKWEKTRDAVIPFLTAQEKRRLDLRDQEKQNEREDEKELAKYERERYQNQIIGSADTGYTNVITDKTTGRVIGQESVRGGTGDGNDGSVGANPAVDSWVQLVQGGEYTLSDVPAKLKNAVAMALTSPEAATTRLRSDIQANLDGKVSYEDTVAEINSDSKIKDKEAALATAREVYGIEEEAAPSAIEAEISRLQANGILTNADIRSSLLNRFPAEVVKNSSVGSVADKIGSFFSGLF